MNKYLKNLLLLTILLFSFTSISTAQSSPNRAEKAKAYFGDDMLIDQDGKNHKLYSDLMAGKVVLINFIYTQCKDACPLLTQQLNQVKQKLGDRFGKSVYFLSFSTDSRQDKPEQLKAFAQKHKVDHAGWRFLTGQPEIIAKVLKKFGQFQDNPADHSTLLLAGKPSNGHWKKIRPDTRPDAIALQLEDLTNEK
jgi:cytochrome oxidase Cu insertion factor (SCO1/SenC/PrrC family)